MIELKDTMRGQLSPFPTAIDELFHDCTAPINIQMMLGWKGSELNSRKKQKSRITEYPKLEETHKDHQDQLLAPHRTTGLYLKG